MNLDVGSIALILAGFGALLRTVAGWVNDLRTENKEQSGQIKTLETENESLRTLNNDLTKRFDDLRDDFDTFKKNRESEQQQYAEQRETDKKEFERKLNAQKQELEAEIERLRKELNQKIEENAKLQSALTVSEETRTRQVVEISQLKEENQTLMEQKVQLETRLDELERKLSNIETTQSERVESTTALEARLLMAIDQKVSEAMQEIKAMVQSLQSPPSSDEGK